MNIERVRERYVTQYISLFRIKFIAGLQYRAAAAAGVATQFAWGVMGILLYKAFYEASPDSFPMSFQALSSYLWLQQAFLALFMGWIFENDIFQQITEGGIAYELCRPLDLYHMWFCRSMANRLSKAVLRCMPILIFAALLPAPYGIGLPTDIMAGVGSLITAVLGFLVVIAYSMLIYIATFFTYTSTGVRMVSVSLVEFLGGAVIPLPFLPEGIRKVVELLPFASMQNIPLRIYSGDITGMDMLAKAGLQIFWIIALVWFGKRLIGIALKRVMVQGG